MGSERQRAAVPGAAARRLRARSALGVALAAALALAVHAAHAAYAGEGYSIDELLVLRWTTIGVAAANLGITFSLWLASRRKAERESLAAVEASLRDEIKEHAQQLQRLATAIEAAPTHRHLADVYRDVKGISQQVNQLVGQQALMNENLRLVLARMVGE